MSSGRVLSFLQPSLVFDGGNHEVIFVGREECRKRASTVFLMWYIVDEITLSGLYITYISMIIKYLQIPKVTISLCERNVYSSINLNVQFILH